MVALDAWIANGTLPPASRYPSRADGTLAEPNAAAVGFPGIPGVTYPARINQAAVVDDKVMPPVRGAAYPAFVPKTDADGRDLAGLRLPTLEAPIATHTGWNLRKAGFGEGELCDNAGSMLPFAKTQDERQKTGDPRLSSRNATRIPAIASQRLNAPPRSLWRRGCYSKRMSRVSYSRPIDGTYC